mmetsp:Transcript_20934/g.45651  ORF Transcript_20934/g.45651 Transcript_20934/m.45651 type:complete len:288 (-) Transcript_20934:138-1001(-)
MRFGATMVKSILVTGSTDGIGLLAAKTFAAEGHNVLLHGRSKNKLNKAKSIIEPVAKGALDVFAADLSSIDGVEALAANIKSKYDRLDVLINNAGILKDVGILKDAGSDLADGRDSRFVVNCLSPYLLTKRLLPIVPAETGRIVNLSSAAQQNSNSVNLKAFTEPMRFSDFDAYAQSKLAITQWSAYLAQQLKSKGGPVVIAINPASMLGTKMVKEGFGVAGNDISIGSDIIVRAALSDEFGSNANGKYYDNDSGRFREPHRDVKDARKNEQLIRVMDDVIASCSSN